MTSITIPDSVMSIGDSAFYRCTGLTSVTIGEGVTSIGEYVFYQCTGVTSVAMPDNVTSIGSYAFYNCKSMENIEIPASATEIEAYAFEYCSGLQTVKYGGSAEDWDEIYIGSNNDYLTSATIIYNYVALTGISAAPLSGEITIVEGMELNPEDIVVTALYKDGTSETVTDYSLSYDTSDVGTQTVTVTYEGFTATFDITVTAKSMTGISIASAPSSTTVVEGMALDTTGLAVAVMYDNGTSEEVTDYTLTGYDTSTVGTQTVTVTYGDYTATFDITVAAKSMTGISITSAPTSTTVIEGMALDTTGLAVTAEYNNGTSEAITDYTLSGYDTSTVGTQTVMVTYGDCTATFDITVTAKSMTGIGIASAPSSTTVVEGMALDTTGLAVAVMYDNGTSEVITDYTLSGYDTSTIGTQTVTVTYGDYTATFDITVAAKSLTGITITTLPTKLAYYAGDALDTTGLTVAAVYNNGTTEAVADYTVSGYDANTAGTQTITVTYGGFTAVFEVTVTAIVPTSIAIISAPTNTIVVEGTALDITGLAVTAGYNDGTSGEVEDYTLTGYDTSIVGTQTVTVSYMGLTAAFDITVTAKSLTGITITTKPDKRSYDVGDALDTTGMVVTAAYNNGTTEEITGYTVSGYDSAASGTQTITVTYGGFTAEYTVTVNDAVVVPTGTAATPRISIGSFIGGKTVTLTSTDDGAVIYYTTDGTAPTTESAVYTAPIALTETATVKAIAAVSGMNNSNAASGKITVSQVADIAASHESGELAVGTIITLASSTTGTTIYYTTDGSVPTTDSTRYSSGIAITAAATINAIAVKDGYKSSDVFTISYTVPTKQTETATVSIGSVTAKAGDDVSVPVYVFLSDDELLTYCRFTMSYDAAAFEYASVTPADGISASDLFTSVSGGRVTVLYSGSAIEAGEICSINLTALASAEDGEYDLTADSVQISSESAGAFETDIISGVITLSGSNNSSLDRYAAGVVLTNDANGGEEVTSADEISGTVSANVTIEDTENGDGATTANVIIAVYDRRGGLITTGIYEVDLSDTTAVYTRSIEIPEGAQVGSIKMMIWSSLNDQSPLTEASTLI